jgi:hypothetical protein
MSRHLMELIDCAIRRHRSICTVEKSVPILEFRPSSRLGAAAGLSATLQTIANSSLHGLKCLFHQSWPIPYCTRKESCMDEVKRLVLITPLIFNIVDDEFQIWRHSIIVLTNRTDWVDARTMWAESDLDHFLKPNRVSRLRRDRRQRE